MTFSPASGTTSPGVIEGFRTAGAGGLAVVAFALAASVAQPAPGHAATPWPQDTNILDPPDELEERLKHESFEVLGMMPSRGIPDERTQRVTLRFADSTRMLVKWAPAPRGGEAFNNRPRYELAAYELQKLFLEPGEYVVPPTVARCFPPQFYGALEDDSPATFYGVDDVLVVLQYWMWNVRGGEVMDEDRLKWDPVYAKHVGNVNVFSFLARHYDSNVGNFLISEDPTRPRVFAVDNGLAFNSEKSNRGTDWAELRVERLPKETVDRLRALDEERLHRALGVVAQFEVRNGHLVPVAPGPNLNPDRGTVWEDGILQLGLTDGEIDDVYDRVEQLLERVDEGDVALF